MLKNRLDRARQWALQWDMRKNGWLLGATFLGCALGVVTIAGIRAEYPLSPLVAREWVAALSGWVAAAGALLAAGLTIPHLRQQVAEAQEQTRFALGNAEPTIEALERGEGRDFPDGADFRIVNWNRRAMSFNILAIDSVLFPGELFAASVDGMYVDDDRGVDTDHYRENGQAIVFHPPFVLEGWRDRSKAPPTLQIRLSFYVLTNRMPRRPVTLSLNYEVADVTPRHGRLEASVIAEHHVDHLMVENRH